jgi:preprotein translocase subunit SecE
VAEKGKEEKVKKPNRLVRWWHETVGELRKVTWPTPQEAWRLTKVVLIVMTSTSIVLGLLDWIFSKLILLIA